MARSIKLMRPSERGFDVRLEVLPSNEVGQLGPAQNALGLPAGPAEDERPPGSLEPAGQHLQRAYGCTIKSSHIAQLENDDRSKRVEVGSRLFQLVRCADKEGAVDAEQGDVGGKLLVLERVEPA